MKTPGKYSIETGPIRPPNEGSAGSLLIRATRNCPWNRCVFCPFYQGEKFEIRDVEDIKRDIDMVKKICSGQFDTSDFYYESVYMVRGWCKGGGKTAFLQDSNSLIMPTEQLIKVVKYLKDSFPSLERITSYARADTILRKELQELIDIRKAGLTRLHVGLESGDEEVLLLIKKGVTPEQHIEAGRKAKKAGFELSEYVMPGLGGRELWEQHATNTARVLNNIDPDYIRLRPLTVHPKTELHQMRMRGEFQMTSPHERLEEIRLMVESLEVSSVICFDHFLNGWRNKEGRSLFDMSYTGYKLPDEKERILQLLEEGLEVPESMHFDPRRSTMTSL